MSIGDIIKGLRKERNLSQKALSTKLGVSSGNIGDWECGRSKPGYDALLSIIKFFNVSPNILFGMFDNREQCDKLKKVTYENFLEQFFKLTKLQQGRVLERIETLLESKEDILVNSDSIIDNTYDTRKESIKDDIEMNLTNYTFNDLLRVPSGINADFALKIRDDSMEPTIKKGSIIYIIKKHNVKNSSISIVSFNGKVICKKFIIMGEIIHLESINPCYQSIIISNSDIGKLDIIGEVLV